MSIVIKCDKCGKELSAAVRVQAEIGKWSKEGIFDCTGEILWETNRCCECDLAVRRFSKVPKVISSLRS